MDDAVRKIIIFGTGSISKLLSSHVKDNVEIIAYLADDESGTINGVPVISRNELNNLTFDYIVVAFGNSIKGIDILRSYGVPDEKIVGFAYTGMSYVDNLFQIEVDNLRHEKLKDENIPVLFNIATRGMYLCDTNIIDNPSVISKDFVRERTLSFLANEIYRNKIDGCVIEIGVSEGDFARSINQAFSDRKLYLFDTFEGLASSDVEWGVSLGWGEKAYVLLNKVVSSEKVIEKMPHRNMCFVKKGYFPYSFDLNEKIAFASLDIDFYKSTKEGLEIIYPHLSKGGYIMVHDFNNIAFEECRGAVTEFCRENNAIYVPIPDKAGTAIIAK